MNNKQKFYDNILLGLFFLFLILFTANKLTNEDDYFWHLNTGKYIVENGFPSTDVFNWVQPNKEWYASSWLWDVMTYQLYFISGYGSLSVLTIIIYIIVFTLLYLILRRFDDNVNLIILMFLFLSFAMFERLTPRPHIITYLFTVILLYIIIDFKYFKGSVNRLYTIPGIILLWVNFHSGFILGYAIVIIFILDAVIIKVRRSKGYPQSLKFFLLIGAACTITLFINPYSYNYLNYVVSSFEANAITNIGEWVSPLSENVNEKFYIILYYLFFFAGFAVLYYSFKTKDAFIMLLTAGLMINSLRAVRYTVDYEITAFIFIVLSLSYLINTIEVKSIREYIKGNEIKLVAGLILILSIYTMLSGTLYKNYLNYNRTTGLGIDSDFYPVQAANFIKNNGLEKIYSKPFNTYEAGGYLTWETGIKNFVDSRASNHYMINEYDTLFNKVLFYPDKFNYYNFDMGFYFDPLIKDAPSVMKDFIYSHFADFTDEWKLVYWDDRCHLFVKNRSESAEIISKYEYKYVTPYNYMYRKPVIFNGYTNDRANFMKEIDRKKSEQPESVYLNAIIKDYVR